MRSAAAAALLVLALAALLSAWAAPAQAAPGDLDPTFSGDGKQTTDFGFLDDARGVVLQPDGKIVAVGRTTGGGGDFALARYNADGSLDASFAGDGRQTTDFGGNDSAFAVALQPDGRIVAVGDTPAAGGSDFALARYNADGSLDPSFAGDGRQTTDFGGNDTAFAVALQPDGKIVAVGFTTSGNDFALARFNPDGTLDPSFAGDGRQTTDFGGTSELGRAVALQPDARIVAVGSTFVLDGDEDFALARYNTDGSLDPSFAGDGRQTTDFGGFDSGEDVALQPDGRIVAVGGIDVGERGDFALARYNPDGSLDASFAGDGRQTTDFGGVFDLARAVALQPDGRIVAVGGADVGHGGGDFALARYNPDGSLDVSFAGDGRQMTDFGGFDSGEDVALRPDGKIVAVGSTDVGHGGGDFALARYLVSDLPRHHPRQNTART